MPDAPLADLSRRQFAALISTPLLLSAASTRAGASTLDALEQGWRKPARSYRQHTRWWWLGNAVSREGIDRQLEQMRAKGYGGVEIVSAWKMYARGNLGYLSPEHFAMLRHAIDKAAALDMEVALTFGPGWDLGAFWVPPDERSKSLAPVWIDVEGPCAAPAPLPAFDSSGTPHTGFYAGFRPPEGNPPDQSRIVAVVAGRWDGARWDECTLVDITASLHGDRLDWKVPAGRWRIGVFRLQYTGQLSTSQDFAPDNFDVDALSKPAMTQYCDHLARTFQRELGDRLGRTVDSFFVDSFEVVPFRGSVLWSNDLLTKFRALQGYDLTRYLPAIWDDIGELTQRVRYDVNAFLHAVALDTFFGTLRESCAAVGVAVRVQPHFRMMCELIQAASATPRPETESSTPRFAVLAYPRKETIAGARFGRRGIVSAEAFTFIHQERYRTTLEELKIATDAFLRDGVTQFYNHGFLYTEESEVAPTRDVSWGERISPWNTWWPYYGQLTAYTSRAAFLCRQGHFVGDLLVYSPMAELWTTRAVWDDDRHVTPYGRLPQMLVANGYDFDPINDDLLQRELRAQDGQYRIGEQAYRVLVLQRTRVMPLATARAILRAVESGCVVIALECVPTHDPGLHGDDAQLRDVMARIFNGRPNAVLLPDYRFFDVPFDPQAQPGFSPSPQLAAGERHFLDELRKRIEPDFSLAGGRQSDGLTFLHRRVDAIDIYFVTNLQPYDCSEEVTFRVTGESVERWDALSGEIQSVAAESRQGATRLRVTLDAWQSAFYVFTSNQPRKLAGAHLRTAERTSKAIDGPWTLSLEGVRFPPMRLRLERLTSWTDSEATRFCSGTGVYDTEFDLPAEYLQANVSLELDLGEVAFVADVVLNGKSVGVRIMHPYRFDIALAALAGRNRLSVRVTNLLLNHVAGLKEMPAIPAKLRERLGDRELASASALGATHRDQVRCPLPPSGLLGPVRVVVRG